MLINIEHKLQDMSDVGYLPCHSMSIQDTLSTNLAKTRTGKIESTHQVTEYMTSEYPDQCLCNGAQITFKKNKKKS